ncbi:MAG TPA: DUF6526 family protein [Acidobacteriaceae bacterium]|nr:DUF6526 family protein [Acidobacteriaceae bacterium]
MEVKPQNFANHVRIHPAFHLVLVPAFFVNIIIAMVAIVRSPDFFTAWNLVMSVALLLLLFLVRINPMRVQDRVIRLEERLRIVNLVPDAMRARISELSERQLIALRFASDKEIPALVHKTLTEHLKPAEIKQAIAEWRSDTLRI